MSDRPRAAMLVLCSHPGRPRPRGWLVDALPALVVAGVGLVDVVRLLPFLPGQGRSWPPWCWAPWPPSSPGGGCRRWASGWPG
ncbi:hypothetical protein ACFQX8_26110 [Klenkia terrae]|uniref:hypothetical protein n=1 Tax=Klenkia terrae TaxID=1052259 RepID=UPI00361528FC